jgi:nucleotide-binding universal stress UspA family protein
VVVPVDAFPSSREAVQRGIALARDAGATLVLVALLPAYSPDPELDRLEFQAAFMAAELGLGFSWYAEPEDDEVRAQRRQRQVLAPLAAMAAREGIPVRIQLLRGGRFAEQLRALIEKTPGAELVLGNPLKLHDELHDLTGEMLLRPPCKLHVEDLDRPRRQRRRPLWRRLLRHEPRSVQTSGPSLG